MLSFYFNYTLLSPFQVRVVVWKARNVISADNFGGMNDLFVKVRVRVGDFEILYSNNVIIRQTATMPLLYLRYASWIGFQVWPEGCAQQNTDTHWRAKRGKASFNW